MSRDAPGEQIMPHLSAPGTELVGELPPDMPPDKVFAIIRDE